MAECYFPRRPQQRLCCSMNMLFQSLRTLPARGDSQVSVRLTCNHQCSEWVKATMPSFLRPPSHAEARPHVGTVVSSPNLFKFSPPKHQTWWWTSLQIIKCLFTLFQPPAVDPNLQVFPTETPIIIQLGKPSLLCPFGVPSSTESINIIKKVFVPLCFGLGVQLQH